MKKNNILILTIALVILLAGAVVTYLYLQNKNTTGTIQQDTFTLTYEYKGNNTWSYTVKGTLPTPCYDVTADAVVAESYPEQVKIEVKKALESDSYVCGTVIKDFNYTGTFNASRYAKIALAIE